MRDSLWRRLQRMGRNPSRGWGRVLLVIGVISPAQEAKAHLRAYHVMKVLLPSIAVVYWAGVVPAASWAGSGRVEGWGGGPDVGVVAGPALPQMIRMWTEPDEVGEPKMVAREA